METSQLKRTILLSPEGEVPGDRSIKKSIRLSSYTKNGHAVMTCTVFSRQEWVLYDKKTRRGLRKHPKADTKIIKKNPNSLYYKALPD